MTCNRSEGKRMDENNTGLDRLSQIYDKLEDKEKELVIKLAEGLLNCQKVFNNGEKKIENIGVKNEN